MTLLVYGAVELLHGPHRVELRPQGDLLVIDLPTWRCAWKLAPLAWAQRQGLRRFKATLAAEGVRIMTCIRGREFP